MMRSEKRKKKLSPYESLKQELSQLLSLNGVCEEEVKRLSSEVPKKWERHDSLVIIPKSSLRDPAWNLLGPHIYECICRILQVERIARKHPIEADTYRSPNVELLWGSDGIVTHIDNKIKYQWDITKCMFSIGNITEKLRIAQLNCTDEVVVDLFAGIGYFVLPYLVHAKAKHVHACEINPNSIEALRNNLRINGVEERCTVYAGDNRITCPSNIADRVNLGLIPSSEVSWKTACKALKDSGGVLHIHANIDSKSKLKSDSGFGKFKFKEWEYWANETVSSITCLLQEVKGVSWSVTVMHLEHVKSYAPHVDHVVLDCECKPLNLISARS